MHLRFHKVFMRHDLCHLIIWKLQIYFFTAFTTILALVIKKDKYFFITYHENALTFRLNLKLWNVFINNQWLTSLAFPFCLWTFFHYTGRKLSTQDRGNKESNANFFKLNRQSINYLCINISAFLSIRFMKYFVYISVVIQ